MPSLPVKDVGDVNMPSNAVSLISKLVEIGRGHTLTNSGRFIVGDCGNSALTISAAGTTGTG
jgi:hypothetical protein